MGGIGDTNGEGFLQQTMAPPSSRSISYMQIPRAKRPDLATHITDPGAVNLHLGYSAVGKQLILAR